MQTLHNLLRVQIIEPGKTTMGGILLTDKSVEPRWARVLEVGPGVPDVTGERLPSFCKPGDIVYMFPMAYNKCDLSGLFGERTVTYFVSEGDVLARCEEEKVTLETLKPIGDWVLIQLESPPEVRTAGGIILPDTVKERPPFARVLKVGDGARVPGAAVHHVLDALCTKLCALAPERADVIFQSIMEMKSHLRATVPPLVKEGDTVIIKQGSPLRLNMEDWGTRGDYYLIPGGDCLAIVNQKEETA